ncbi:hypothetical protein BCC1697_001704 [Burkholderia gladioli]
MQPPNVDNFIKDPVRDVIFNVRAYRTLSRPELVQAVQFFLRQNGQRKLKAGTTITILSVIR